MNIILLGIYLLSLFIKESHANETDLNNEIAVTEEPVIVQVNTLHIFYAGNDKEDQVNDIMSMKFPDYVELDDSDLTAAENSAGEVPIDYIELELKDIMNHSAIPKTAEDNDSDAIPVPLFLVMMLHRYGYISDEEFGVLVGAEESGQQYEEPGERHTSQECDPEEVHDGEDGESIATKPISSDGVDSKLVVYYFISEDQKKKGYEEGRESTKE